MAQIVSFIVLVVALLINIFSCCSAENVYCVTPTAASCSSCPPNSAKCRTLSEYAQEAQMYFISNTTMVFLPGDHYLDTSISVDNVVKFTMHGESSLGNTVTVVRNGSVSFNFTNMVDFKITSLVFTSCSKCGTNDSYQAMPGIAAVLVQSTHYAELVNCSFRDNFCTALLVKDTNMFLAENNEFTHNHCACESANDGCEIGCGITVLNSTLTFTGNLTFLGNNGALDSLVAGAISASRSTLHFTGSSNFIGNNNSAQFGLGGAIYATTYTKLSFTETTRFSNNSAPYGGGAIYAETNTSLSFSGTTHFNNNSAFLGGAININNTVLTFNGFTSFIANSAANGSGGVIYAVTKSFLSFTGVSSFSHNSAKFGGAILTLDNTKLTFSGSSHFTGNCAASYGGVILAEAVTSLSFTGINNFRHNSAGMLGGAICLFNESILSFSETSSFDNNVAMKGGAIYTYLNSTLAFNGSASFTNNGNNKLNSEGNSLGGGIYVDDSTLSILTNTTVYWENNRATLGGAIYVFDVNPLIYCTHACIAIKECFFQFNNQTISNGIDVQLVFKDNIADAGSVLYGGAIDHCKLNGFDTNSSGEVFDMIVHIESNNTISEISSDPFHVCPCENNISDCKNLTDRYSVYPGETFAISVVAVGQRYGTVPAAVRSYIQYERGELLGPEYLQRVNNACTTLKYNVFSLSANESIQLELYADGPCSTVGDKLTVLLNMNLSCPSGFNFSKSTRSCICEKRIQMYTNQCNITNGLGQITRDSNKHFWIGFNESCGEVILHPHCPFDYCVNQTVEFPLNNTDLQCAYNRSGLLCGECKKNFSVVLGTSHCKQCANNHLVLIIPFAVMGVALVFFLFVCKLTVATGTLSGLLFYANIVGVNRTIFLPVESTDALSVFIAWLNLDFGIETCFYNGMDAYSNTWLQFVFPIYIWVLVGLMIVVSKYSHGFANLLGSNPVSVLATLILFSYTKILYTLIAAINITYLEYPKFNRRVWLYDASVNYLAGKHIPLFLVAVLVFIFLFLPYTLLLLFGQWLQAMSHLRLFSWVNKLKPFMDSYHAPYKARHRYWPGLLLFIRSVLFLIFALNPQQDPSINLLAILVGTGMLQMWAWLSGGVYRNWFLDVLEGSFALNLIILVGATYHINHSGGNPNAAWYTSVIIAFVTFIAILINQIFQQIRNTTLWKKAIKLNLKIKKLNIRQARNNRMEGADLNQFREPLLEDLPEAQPNYGAFGTS